MVLTEGRCARRRYSGTSSGATYVQMVPYTFGGPRRGIQTLNDSWSAVRRALTGLKRLEMSDHDWKHPANVSVFNLINRWGIRLA